MSNWIYWFRPFDSEGRAHLHAEGLNIQRKTLKIPKMTNYEVIPRNGMYYLRFKVVG